MNESIIALPPNVEEPQVLKRFLQNLIVELDEVLGFRGSDASVRQSDLKSVAQGTVATFTDLAEALAELTSRVDALAEIQTVAEDDLDLELSSVKSRLDDLETWQTNAQAVLEDHETRITALETP